MAGRIESLALRNVTAFSKGIFGIPHLETLIGAERFVSKSEAKAAPQALDAVVGWGFKATATRARAFAARHHVPYVALEDGFLRSAGGAQQKPPPISIVLDDVGIYYEARQPSRLERLIRQAAEDPDILETGRAVRRRMLDLKLTKYNTVSLNSAEALIRRPRRVLIVDQTFNDQAVAGAGAGARTFHRMIATAQRHFEAADIVVKSHPDVVAGRSRGYLDEQARLGRIDVVAESVNPFDLLEFVDEVWTVSSGFGFEALLAGKRVRAFGAPFYAGWGLTDDADMEPRAHEWLKRRRESPAAVDHLVAAALVAYPHYADPVRFEPLDVFAAMERLAEWRERTANRKTVVGYDLSVQKRQIARLVFGAGPAPLAFESPATALDTATAVGADLLAWYDRIPPAVEAEAQRRGLGILRFAHGPLRTRGIETPAVPLPAVAVDPVGLFVDPSRPSGLEEIVAAAEFDAAELARAAALRADLVALDEPLRRAAAATCAEIVEQAAGRRIVLVAGEMASSAVLRLGAAGVTGNKMLAAAVREAHPDDFVVFVEPTELSRRRKGGWLPAAALRRHADYLIRDEEVAGYFPVADAVHVITSPVGFEALLAGKRVVTWGMPFYAGWGLTEDRVPIPRRTRRLTVDELGAALLLRYLRYVDPVSGMLCEAEDILARMRSTRGRARGVPAPTLLRRLKHKFVRLEAALRHAVSGSR